VADPDCLKWLPDWRDAAAYPFERLDRAGFAWEWLRRDPAYRAAARDALRDEAERATDPRPASPMAAQWGLVALEPPELAAPDARPLWRDDIDRDVLTADAVACGGEEADAFDPERLAPLATAIVGKEATHWLFTDGWRHLRIDIFPPIPASQTFAPRWRLSGMGALPSRLLTLQRLVSLNHSKRFAIRLWPPDPRARRWILGLRAHDALAGGASHRDIAEMLGGPEVHDAGWRHHDPSLRLRAQRLAAFARRWTGPAFARRFLMHSGHHDPRI
jgi:hypothetical protein